MSYGLSLEQLTGDGQDHAWLSTCAKIVIVQLLIVQKSCHYCIRRVR